MAGDLEAGSGPDLLRNHRDGQLPAPKPAEPPAPPPLTGKSDQPWYRDPPRVAGVLGFVLALATVGERLLVREQQLALERSKQLRDIVGQLADIQVDFLDALAKAPPNLYSLSVATNTKRQMLLYTAGDLLTHPAVKRQAGPQVLGALGVEAMTDGRYEAARTYFTDALVAAGSDDATRPYLMRSLAQLYRVPNTSFADARLAREYFEGALGLLDKRLDEAGRLVSAETILTEASVEVVYGDSARVKALVGEARKRLQSVRAVSPLKSQLEQLAAAFERGEQYVTAQQQVPTSAQHAPPPAPTQPLPAPDSIERAADRSATAGADKADGARDVVAELWSPTPGQISGVEMDVTIDGKPMGRVTNLTGNRRVTLRELTAGVHSFSFTNMKAYFISMDKPPSLTGGGFGCAGLFEVRASAKTLKFNVGSGANGMLCALGD